MNRLMGEWAMDDAAWTGDWRKAYMDEETEKKSKLIAMHDLWFYSSAWMRAVTHPRLIGAMTDLLGPNVELHHSTMHVKPPQTGHPFPMRQTRRCGLFQHFRDPWVLHQYHRQGPPTGTRGVQES